MAPKVRIGTEYEIFYGLSKALNVGRVVKPSSRHANRKIGTVISVDENGGFGFIRGGEQQFEYYFKLNEYQHASGRKPTIGEKVSFEAQVKYARPRARAVRHSR